MQINFQRLNEPFVDLINGTDVDSTNDMKNNEFLKSEKNRNLNLCVSHTNHENTEELIKPLQ